MRTLARPSLLACAALASALLLKCGGGGSAAVQTTTPPPPSGNTGGVTVGTTAREITGINAEGKTVALSSTRGKVVVLVFSTMWCGPCKAEAPRLQDMHANFVPKGAEVLGVLLENEGGGVCSQADVKRWADTYGLKFPLINDPTRSTNTTYQIKAIPTNLVIDKAGVIQYRREGFVESEVVAKVNSLL